MMRAGHSPEDACRIAVERVSKSPKNVKEMQIGFIAINKHGEYGGYALQKGFNFAVYSSKIKNELQDANHLW
jgi:isoaspartyl peptidase/L-asparaginase-like protein (Ntn-hydrolase superfamily)